MSRLAGAMRSLKLEFFSIALTVADIPEVSLSASFGLISFVRSSNVIIRALWQVMSWDMTKMASTALLAMSGVDAPEAHARDMDTTRGGQMMMIPAGPGGRRRRERRGGTKMSAMAENPMGL